MLQTDDEQIRLFLGFHEKVIPAGGVNRPHLLVEKLKLRKRSARWLHVQLHVEAPGGVVAGLDQILRHAGPRRHDKADRLLSVIVVLEGRDVEAGLGAEVALQADFVGLDLFGIERTIGQRARGGAAGAVTGRILAVDVDVVADVIGQGDQGRWHRKIAHNAAETTLQPPQRDNKAWLHAILLANLLKLRQKLLILWF